MYTVGAPSAVGFFVRYNARMTGAQKKARSAPRSVDANVPVLTVNVILVGSVTVRIAKKPVGRPLALGVDRAAAGVGRCVPRSISDLRGADGNGDEAGPVRARRVGHGHDHVRDKHFGEPFTPARR